MESFGVKGSDVYSHSDVGDSLLILSTLLVRGASSGMIEEKMSKILDENRIEDAFVLSFMNRNIRGGKGERDLFYSLYSTLLKKKTELAIDLLDLVPHFGYWNDLFVLTQRNKEIEPHTIKLVKKQFLEDEQNMRDCKSVSLLAKWIPREGKPLAKRFAVEFSSKQEIQQRFADYRKRVSTLNKYLKTTEISMCANKWGDISADNVPARCLKLNTRAFLNENLINSALRHPDNIERNLCRNHFKEYFTSIAEGKKIGKGADTIYPHEIIRSISTILYSDDEHNALVGTWNAIVTKAKEGGGLGRSIPMCDFSGSMSGLPVEVSIALGLLISEVTTGAFKNKMLTFDSTPKMIDLPDSDIFKKVEYLIKNSQYGQGVSTDFQKAMELVLENLVDNRVPVGEEPENLIVLTDMAWDQACGSNEISIYTHNMYNRNVKTKPWQTHIQMIRDNFKRAGEDMFGKGNGYKIPRIVIWNLSASCQDMHAKANEEGVVMLSGWSPTLFKVLMAKGVEVQTPYSALRYQLDDEMYDIVRKRIAQFNGGLDT